MSDVQKTVLIIDDEERVRELLLEFLSEFDEFALSGAGSGEEALESLQQRPADLCVVDMRLPGMDGVRFILEAWAAGLCRRFIVHTGSVDFLLPRPLHDLNMTQADVFYKPVNAVDMVERIRARLNAV